MGEIQTRRLSCGMPVVVEHLDQVSSVALQWWLPAGSSIEEDGGATLLGEWVQRGAGNLDSRAFGEALERIGLRRSCTVATHHVRLGAVLLGARLAEALPLLASMVREPRLDDAVIESVRRLSLQSLRALEDDPAAQVMQALHAHHRPAPLNRSGLGRLDVLEGAEPERLRDLWRRRFVPGGAILAASGAVDPDAFVAQLEGLLEGWEGDAAPARPGTEATRGVHDLQQETAQVHLAMAWDAPREADADSVSARIVAEVLGGSASSRLFTEIRQRRSLCYSVGAVYRAARDHGVLAVHAGTTPQRATRTLEVIREEIDRLERGIDEGEFERAVTSLRSALVLRGESSAARASVLAPDHDRIGRARPLAERLGDLKRATLDEVNAFLAGWPERAPTIVSLGSAPVTAAGSD